MAADPTGISSSDPGPQSAASDGQNYASFPISEQIKRAQFLALKAAQPVSRRQLFGFGKFILPGCPADQQTSGIGGLGSFDNSGSVGF